MVGKTLLDNKKLLQNALVSVIVALRNEPDRYLLIDRMQQYRTQSGFFNVTIVKGNIYESPTGTFRGFADGFFVFLQPLPPGKHDVNLKVGVLNPVETNYNYNADWTYHLIVEPSNTASQ